MRVIKRWIIVDGKTGDFCCEHCNATEAAKIPASIEAFIKQGEDFAAMHKACPEPPPKDLQQLVQEPT